MSQTWDVDLISPTGTSPSADIQRIIDGFNTVRSTWSGASEPAVADRVAYMMWADTTTGLLKIRNAANSAWVTIGTMAIANMGQFASFSQTKTGAYTVVAADRGSLISCTGTFTVTFTAAATLGDSWTCIVRNEGVGQILLDPNSAELIDGAATLQIMPGESVIVYCTGSALKTFNRLPVGAPEPNPIINGNMEIWQRGTLFSGVTGLTYSADRWRTTVPGATAVCALRQSANVPAVAQANPLFNYSLEVDVTTADAVLDVADFSEVSTIIEGYNWRHFAQRTFTVSFWVSSTKTGIHCLSMTNSGQNRNYFAEYTINSSDTWEYKMLTIPASPSAGTWNYTNGVGLHLMWVLASGTARHGTAGAWTSAAENCTANQVNCFDAATNFFRITGVNLELGSVATPIKFLPFGEELARCQRYYQKSFHYATTPGDNVTTTAQYQFLCTVTGATGFVGASTTLPGGRMRATPTMVLYNPGSGTSGQILNQTDSVSCTASAISPFETHFSVAANANAGSVPGELMAFHWTANAEL